MCVDLLYLLGRGTGESFGTLRLGRWALVIVVVVVVVAAAAAAVVVVVVVVVLVVHKMV